MIFRVVKSLNFNLLNSQEPIQHGSTQSNSNDRNEIKKINAKRKKIVL